MFAWRIAVFLVVLFGVSCRRSSEVLPVRLVDRFGSAKIEGAPQGKPLEPGALWDFSHPPAGATDALLGWKAGPGVEGLKVAEGKLTGRTTTDFPILYVGIPKTVDRSDAFDSVELRIRVNRGALVAATGTPAKPDWKAIVQRGQRFPLAVPESAARWKSVSEPDVARPNGRSYVVGHVRAEACGCYRRDF